MEELSCRACGSRHLSSFIDLGRSPISNDLPTANQISPDPKYPLHVRVCDECSFLQLPAISEPEDLFRSDYVYFSSFSQSWLDHCERFATDSIKSLPIGKDDLVIEVASNDGYMLQFFKEAGIRVLGIEPVAGVARVAEHERQIPTLVKFFGEKTALEVSREHGEPKLIVANNVLAHVPDIHDFIEGFSILLGSEGVATFEFPHFVQMIRHNQFDTIYHEHYSYLGLTSLLPVFDRHDLRIFDVMELSTHGGSLRIFVCKKDAPFPRTERVETILGLEASFDPRDEAIGSAFREKAILVRETLISELERHASLGRVVAGYGAAAKGNTLLNYAGIDSKLLSYVVDRNPHKVGRFLPGSRIPIVDEANFSHQSPDVVLILPWNIASEVTSQLDYLREKGTLFLRAIPALEYL